MIHLLSLEFGRIFEKGLKIIKQQTITKAYNLRLNFPINHVCPQILTRALEVHNSLLILVRIIK